jgi:opacity protein-like surface antigen
VARFARGGIQPYVTGGVAFVSSDYTIDPVLAQQLAEFNFTANESFDSTVGFNIGGGVDFEVSRSVGFFAEGRFLAATTDTTAGLVDDISGIEASNTGSQDIDVFTIAGGIRILF